MKALIVEDLPESQELLCEVAGRAFPSIECVCVADVAGALAQIAGPVDLRLQPFDLALIDLSLPDGSGIQLIEALTTHMPACAVVVATIFDDDEHLFTALQVGARGYLLKDEPTEALIEQLESIRAGRLPLSPSVAQRILQFFRRVEPQPIQKADELTSREQEVLALIARGFSIVETGRMLNISHHTVGHHVKSIYRKLNISSRAEAALRAKRLGVL